MAKNIIEKITFLSIMLIPAFVMSQNSDQQSNPYVIGQCMAYIGNEISEGRLDSGKTRYMNRPKSKALFEAQAKLMEKHPICWEGGTDSDLRACLQLKKVPLDNISFASGYNTGAANINNNSALKLYSNVCRD